MSKEKNLTILFWILFALVVGYGVDKYFERKWETKSCYQFSVRTYELSEEPLRCKWQQIIYKDTEPENLPK